MRAFLLVCAFVQVLPSGGDFLPPTAADSFTVFFLCLRALSCRFCRLVVTSRPELEKPSLVGGLRRALQPMEVRR